MIQSIRLDDIRRRNRGEFACKMVPCSADSRGDGTEFAGEVIVERFGRPEIHRGHLRDTDLKPEFRDQHRGSARYVARRMTLGRPGRFNVRAGGYFVDFHGGTGLRSEDDIQWFTEEALARGIGWYFHQTYLHDNRPVQRFKVIRIFGTAGGGRVTVTKLPLR